MSKRKHGTNENQRNKRKKGSLSFISLIFVCPVFSFDPLKVSLRTVQRDWNLVRLWLYRELQSGGSDDA